jgi:hypothetical protein
MPKPGMPVLFLLLAVLPVFARADKSKGEPVTSTIDRLLADSSGDTSATPSAGSLYAMGGTLGDLAHNGQQARLVCVRLGEFATGPAYDGSADKLG